MKDVTIKRTPTGIAISQPGRDATNVDFHDVPALVTALLRHRDKRGAREVWETAFESVLAAHGYEV